MFSLKCNVFAREQDSLDVKYFGKVQHIWRGTIERERKREIIGESEIKGEKEGQGEKV